MEYKEYHSTINNFKRNLSRDGVAVIPSVLNEDEIKNMQDGMWSMLNHVTKNFKTPIKETDSKTWRSFYLLYPLHSMLLQHFGLGHAQFVWNVRQNPKIVDIFAKLWDCNRNELLTSFDGLSIHFPPEKTKKGAYKHNDWLHTDQSYIRNEFECIQSFVSGYEIREGDATLTILEGSHNYHAEFAQHFNKTDKSDWYRLNDEEYQWYINKGCARKCIKCPAGSVVMWDSRTIHCGQESQKDREKENIRLVVYVCMTPRKLANEANIIKKQNAFNDMRTTSHWPHKIKLFPKEPRTYGGDMPNVNLLDKPVLTDLGMKLAGF
jgi:hypothetical protein